MCDRLPIEAGSTLYCHTKPPFGRFTVGKTYKVASRTSGVGMIQTPRLRVRDDYRERADFNFCRESRNFLFKYFHVSA